MFCHIRIHLISSFLLLPRLLTNFHDSCLAESIDSRLIKLTSDQPPPSDSFFNLHGDTVAQNLIKTFGKNNHKQTSIIQHVQVLQPKAKVNNDRVEEGEEVTSNSRKSKLPYKYSARKEPSEYKYNPQAIKARRYLDMVRSDPKKMAKYQNKRKETDARYDAKQMSELGKMPFKNVRKRISALIQLEKAGMLNKEQEKELARKRKLRNESNKRYFNKLKTNKEDVLQKKDRQ